MNINAILPTVFLGLLVSAGAAPPVKPAVDHYSVLWLNSPFTVPTEAVAPDPPSGQLDGFVLAGVSKLPDGYFVVLINRGKPGERIVIAPGDPNPRGFRVESVTQDPADYLATRVRISVRGEESAVLGYDEKLLRVGSRVRSGGGLRP